MDLYTLILVPLLVAIVPSFISYLVSSRQAANELKLAKEQQAAALELMKEQQASALQLAKEQQAAALQQLKEQQENEIRILREQQNSEMEKIKYQSEHELEKMKTEMDKQAELHERNAQTDITKDIFAQMMGGDGNVMGNLLESMEQIEAIQKKVDSGAAKNNNHPASNRRR